METSVQGQREQQRQFLTLDSTLSEIARVNVNQEQRAPMFQQEHLRQLGGMLWTAIPNQVTDLELGAVRISRRLEQRDNRQTWNLLQLDQHAANVARTLGSSYTPKFSAPPGPTR